MFLKSKRTRHKTRSRVLFIIPDHKDAQIALKNVNSAKQPASLITSSTPRGDVARALDYKGKQTIITTDLALIDYPPAHHSFTMVIRRCEWTDDIYRFMRYNSIDIDLNGES